MKIEESEIKNAIGDLQVVTDIRISSKEQIDNLTQNYNGTYSLSIENMSLLNIDELDRLIQKINILYIRIPNHFECEHGKFRERYNYSIEEYKELRIVVDKMIKNIDKNALEIEKFMQIYIKLGEIIYDFNENGEPNENPEAHNLKGALIKKQAVCEGYALALRQALECIGIECKYVEGYPHKPESTKWEGHAWNQVKINGKWYNCDLTWDADKIREGRELEYCLQSDEEFINHDEFAIDLSKWREECSESYDRNIINNCRHKIQNKTNKKEEYIR